MHIGIDATCWRNRRGYGRFTRELVPVMATLAPRDSFTCFVDERDAAQLGLEMPNVLIQGVALGARPAEAASADGHRAVRDMLRLSRVVGKKGLDVFFSPSVYTYFPLPIGLRAVVTVHDAIAERFPELTLPSRRAQLFWRCKVTLALWQSTLVLTVSDFAAAEIARVLGVRRARIRVAPEAPATAYRQASSSPDVAAARSRVGLPVDARWFVYVGGFSPHKNVDVLVRAHAAIARDRGADAPHLLLVGTLEGDAFYGDLPRIRRTIEQEGSADLVHWTGFLPDDELRLIHAGAVAAVLPSACEGFGLPAIEAAAAGALVIATTESPLPQLLEGEGLFVEPGDLNGLVKALGAALDDENGRRTMACRARERALELTWERTALAALEALKEAAA
jgi:glycosyltransferase involved in cell wall biosynthesis